MGVNHSPYFIVQLPDLGESEPLTAAKVYCSTHDQSVPLRAEASTELVLMAMPADRSSILLCWVPLVSSNF